MGFTGLSPGSHSGARDARTGGGWTQRVDRHRERPRSHPITARLQWANRFMKSVRPQSSRQRYRRFADDYKHRRLDAVVDAVYNKSPEPEPEPDAVPGTPKKPGN